MKVFEEEYEEDLEDDINEFLETIEERQLVDIKYQVAVTNGDNEAEIYSFSAMIIYKA